MFSGIVESVQNIEKFENGNGSLGLWISRPADFNDLKIGDSISINGICLTLEEFTSEFIKFTLGAETLKILGASLPTFLNRNVNLERSLKWGDRIHGHLVSGHIESLGMVTRSEASGDSWIIEIKCSSESLSFILQKGSIALHGVSLTVNEVKGATIQVCLIPETLRKTNLKLFQAGDLINLETDLNVKSLLKTFDNKELLKKLSEQIRLSESEFL